MIAAEITFKFILANTISTLLIGSIVSAFSYVNGEFPDYSILRGQPAKVIGSTKDIDTGFLAEFPELECFYYDTCQNQ